MILLNWQEIFYINRFTTSRWDAPSREDVYFEMILIEEGSGRISLNGKTINYKSRDSFVFTQDEKPDIKVYETTTFIVYRLTQLMFSSKINLNERQYWLRRCEYIFNHPKRRFDTALRKMEDQDLVWRIIFLINKENINKEQYYLEIIANMLSTLLSILARNVTDTQFSKELLLKSAKKTERIDEIYAYIRYNIYDSKKLKIANIAKHFHITSSTLSNYFKKETGNSLHNYIILYKLEIIKDRLLNSEFTVSQIAIQLGFTDESHLTRIFKKYCDSTPKQFKIDHGQD